MSKTQEKPLNWTPSPGIGYTVTRRPDGGMHFVFTDTTKETLEHWLSFAHEHLLDSDRLTRNLYDLRQLDDLTEMAVQYAVEANNDPSVRNIRLAVVASNEKVKEAIKRVGALTTAGGVEMGLFETIDQAEAWLDRPLTLLT
jgi:hypothetical protein